MLKFGTMQIHIIKLHLMTCLLLAACLFTASCGREKSLPDDRNPYYISGVQLRERSEYRQAAAAFERCLRLSPDSAKAHLQLGTLYDDHFEDPLTALYHYHQYLRKKPDGENRDMVRRWRAGAEDRIYEKLSAVREPAAAPEPEPQPLPEPNPGVLSERERNFIERIKVLTFEVQRLRRELDALQNVSAKTPAPAASEPVRPAVPVVALKTSPQPATVYTVKPGDTLIKISTELFGSGRYWPQLRDANTEVLGEKNTLIPGMELRIPQLAE